MFLPSFLRLSYRQEWDVDFRGYLKGLDAEKPVILCGDLNVAHNAIGTELESGHRCLGTRNCLEPKINFISSLPSLFGIKKARNELRFNGITTDSPSSRTEWTDAMTWPRLLFSWILHLDAIKGSISLWWKSYQLAYFKCSVQSITADFRLFHGIDKKRSLQLA